MANTETLIAEALVDRLKSLPVSPMPAIAWPNKDFTPEPDATYLKVSLVPATPFQAAFGAEGFNRHIGFFQVDVMWPVGEGLKQPLIVADAIVAHFRRGTDIDTEGGAFKVQINRPPYILQGVKDPADPTRHQVPVRVFYLADAPNPA